MKKITLFIIGLFICGIVLADSTERQTRRVVVDDVWNCSKDRAEAIIDMFVYQMQTDMNQLFTWAFLGTENQGDTKGKDAVSIKYVGNTYDPETRAAVLITTIEVLGVPWFKNREVGSIYRDSTVNGTRYARLDITYSGSLLQAADGQFHTSAIDDTHTRMHFELNVVLGRFFSAFVTNKTWNEVAVWRIETIVDNIQEFSETGTVKPKKE
jgi:hypothetical protein